MNFFINTPRINPVSNNSENALVVTHLLGTGLTDPELFEPLHFADGIELHLLDLAGVDDESDTVDGHRRLSDVRRHDALPHTFRRVVEHFVLVLEEISLNRFENS